MKTPAKLKERHVDRILAEELETSPAFARWLVGRLAPADLPPTLPTECSTIISFQRSSGETDIRAEIGWENGAKAVIHIEDKLGAVPQPKQAERYQLALAEEEAAFVAALLVAPTAWIRRHPREAARYDGTLPLEDVAAWLKERAVELSQQETPAGHELARRLSWRADVLSGSQARRAVYGALHSADLTRWNEEAAAVIEAYNGLQLQIYPRQKSAGHSKQARFFNFLDPLTRQNGGQRPTIVLKTRNDRHPGRVSLQIKRFLHDPALLAAAREMNFEVEELTKVGTLLITVTDPLTAKLDVNVPVVRQLDLVEAAATIAQMLIEWWEGYLVAQS